MSEIIEKTYALLDTLDKSELIKNLTKYKNKLLNNKLLLSKITEIKKETNSELIIAKRKELYKDNDYKMYMKYYNELYYIVLKINKQYAKYTNTKEHHCNG